MYEILEHTADIGIRARGRTFNEVLENAALGVVSLATEVELVQGKEQYQLSASGEDQESLLVNWLNEVIFQVDGKRLAFSGFRVKWNTGTEIAVEARGEPMDPLRHRGALVVKAATYHQLRLRHEDGSWLAEVFLDI